MRLIHFISYFTFIFIFQIKRERDWESQREKKREVMKYLEVEVEGAPEQAKRRVMGDEASNKRRAMEQATWSSRATSDKASDMTDQQSLIRSNERSPMPESWCNVLWTGAQVVLADRSPMRRWQCPIHLLAYVAVFTTLLCWRFCL